MKYPVNIKCPRCSEKAKYIFVTEAAKVEYEHLWELRHADCGKEKPAPLQQVEIPEGAWEGYWKRAK